MAARFLFVTLLGLAVFAIPVWGTQKCATTWGQCGGKEWTGPTCCEGRSTCEPQNGWYSQCLPTASTNPEHRVPTSDVPLVYTVQEERTFRELAFNWTVAWDQKSISTWLAITGPQIVADYTDYPAVGRLTIASPEDIFTRSFAVTGLGDTRLETQHFLGAAFFSLSNGLQAKGHWQARARHVRRLSNGTTAQWDSSSFLELSYVKIDGIWKIGGLRPHTVVATTGQPEDVIGAF